MALLCDEQAVCLDPVLAAHEATAHDAPKAPAVSGSEPTIFRLTGEVDFLGREAFHGALEDLVDHDTVILDFSETEYMDSSGISQVLLLSRARKKAGRSAPRVVQGPGVSRVFDVAGLATLVPVFDSVEQARRGVH